MIGNVTRLLLPGVQVQDTSILCHSECLVVTDFTEPNLRPPLPKKIGVKANDGAKSSILLNLLLSVPTSTLELGSSRIGRCQTRNEKLIALSH